MENPQYQKDNHGVRYHRKHEVLRTDLILSVSAAEQGCHPRINGLHFRELGHFLFRGGIWWSCQLRGSCLFSIERRHVFYR